MKDYYKILQISPDASREVIEKVYKTLAKQYHPDMNSIENRRWAEEKFKEINEAYEVLSDDMKRRRYDIERNNELSDINKKYYDMLEKNEELRKQLGSLKENKTSQYSDITHNKNNKNTNNSFNINYIFSILSSIKDSIVRKSADERKKDFISLILTIIIVSTVLFILWHIEPVREFFYKI